MYAAERSHRNFNLLAWFEGADEGPVQWAGEILYLVVAFCFLVHCLYHIFCTNTFDLPGGGCLQHACWKLFCVFCVFWGQFTLFAILNAEGLWGDDNKKAYLPSIEAIVSIITLQPNLS